MTEKRHTYEDTYSPVIDLPPAQSENPSPSYREEEIVHVGPKKKAAPKGRRVKASDRTRRAKEANPAGKTAAPASFRQRAKEFFESQTLRWLAGIVIGGFGVYLLVAFVSYFANCIEDQAAIANSPVGSLPPVGNKAGEGGARLSEFLINGSFGLGSFVLIFWLVAVALKMLSGWPKFKTVNFTIKCVVALITVSLIVGLITLASNTPVNWGGYHGRYVNEFIIGFCGWIGAAILCLVFVAAFVIICLRDMVNWILRKRREIAARRREAQRLREEEEARERELEEMRRRELEDAVKAGEASAETEYDVDADSNTVKFAGDEVDIDPTLRTYDLDDEPIETGQPEAASEDTGACDAAALSESPALSVSPDSVNTDFPGSSEPDLSESDPSESDVVGSEPSAEGASPAPSESSEASEDAGESEPETESPETPSGVNGPGMVVNVNQIAKSDSAALPQGGSMKHLYKFPSPALLRESEHHITVDIEEQAANKERIRETLLYHKIPITSIEATVGPTVTLYEVRPEQGVKIAKIKNLADDIALSLAAKGVRVIAPIPGKGTVGIEVANAEPQTVSMRTIIESRKYNETRYRLPVALGSTIGNDVYIADLTKMPHLLVAGATGQGKSVGLNAIIASLLYKKRPDELKFVMIDPKEVEFSLYAKIESHYLAKIEGADAIVTDMSKVVMTLLSLCQEMDDRYKLLRLAGVRNIEEYNGKIEHGQLNPSDGHRFMPYIVLVVDEFADLIMTSGKEVETPIARLAQKARAIGIHVIIATQRPSTNVITGIIKANFPVRIAFRVSSGIDSKTILDTTGAQQLIGKGDMLISNNSEMVRVQCAFIDTPEVEEICNYIERQPFNSGPYLLPDPLVSDGESGGAGGMISSEARDPLFEEVGEIVVTSGVGSTSGIQRRLSIGYNRAGKIMDQLEQYGVVGPSMGGKPRQVLMDLYGFQELLKTLK